MKKVIVLCAFIALARLVNLDTDLQEIEKNNFATACEVLEATNYSNFDSDGDIVDYISSVGTAYNLNTLQIDSLYNLYTDY